MTDDKERLIAQQAQAAQVQGGILGEAPQRLYEPPTLRERVSKNLAAAAGEARRLDDLKELYQLLTAYPSVARILELVERLRT